MKVNIDSPIYKGDVLLIGYDKLIGMRCAAATAFGKTLSYITTEDKLLKIFEALLGYLKSCHATSRLLASFVIEEYANALHERSIEIPAKVVELLAEPLTNVLQNQNHCLHLENWFLL